MNYNPYDLIPLTLNNHSTFGRPVEFDSTIVNHKNLTNAFGNIVKPTKVSTTCSDCGQGYVLDVDLGEPPFNPIEVNCPICKPNIVVEESPFVDPITSGIVAEHEINPSLVDLDAGIKSVETTVADRLVRDTGDDLEDQKLEEQKLEEQKLEEQKLEEQKLEEQKLEEQKLAEQKLEEQKLEEQKATKSKTKSKPKTKSKDKVESKSASKSEAKADAATADDFVDYGTKRSLPKAEDMTPEVDLDSLED
jgi:hypothetical protein